MPIAPQRDTDKFPKISRDCLGARYSMISTENRPGKGARDIAPSDACQRWKGGYPLREGDFDISRPAVGLRLRAYTSDA